MCPFVFAWFACFAVQFNCGIQFDFVLLVPFCGNSRFFADERRSAVQNRNLRSSEKSADGVPQLYEWFA